MQLLNSRVAMPGDPLSTDPLADIEKQVELLKARYLAMDYSKPFEDRKKIIMEIQRLLGVLDPVRPRKKVKS